MVRKNKSANQFRQNCGVKSTRQLNRCVETQGHYFYKHHIVLLYMTALPRVVAHPIKMNGRSVTYSRQCCTRYNPTKAEIIHADFRRVPSSTMGRCSKAPHRKRHCLLGVADFMLDFHTSYQVLTAQFEQPTPTACFAAPFYRAKLPNR